MTGAVQSVGCPASSPLLPTSPIRTQIVAIAKRATSDVASDRSRQVAGVVEGARLESDSGDAQQVIPKHLFAQSIQRLPATECFSM